MDVLASDVAFICIETCGFVELGFECMLHTLDKAFSPGLLVNACRVRARSVTGVELVSASFYVSFLRHRWQICRNRLRLTDVHEL